MSPQDLSNLKLGRSGKHRSAASATDPGSIWCCDSGGVAMSSLPSKRGESDGRRRHGDDGDWVQRRLTGKKRRQQRQQHQVQELPLHLGSRDPQQQQHHRDNRPDIRFHGMAGTQDSGEASLGARAGYADGLASPAERMGGDNDDDWDSGKVSPAAVGNGRSLARPSRLKQADRGRSAPANASTASDLTSYTGGASDYGSGSGALSDSVHSSSPSVPHRYHRHHVFGGAGVSGGRKPGGGEGRKLIPGLGRTAWFDDDPVGGQSADLYFMSEPSMSLSEDDKSSYILHGLGGLESLAHSYDVDNTDEGSSDGVDDIGGGGDRAVGSSPPPPPPVTTAVEGAGHGGGGIVRLATSAKAAIKSGISPLPRGRDFSGGSISPGNTSLSSKELSPYCLGGGQRYKLLFDTSLMFVPSLGGGGGRAARLMLLNRRKSEGPSDVESSDQEQKILTGEKTDAAAKEMDDGRSSSRMFANRKKAMTPSSGKDKSDSSADIDNVENFATPDSRMSSLHGSPDAHQPHGRDNAAAASPQFMTPEERGGEGTNYEVFRSISEVKSATDTSSHLKSAKHFLWDLRGNGIRQTHATTAGSVHGVSSDATQSDRSHGGNFIQKSRSMDDVVNSTDTNTPTCGSNEKGEIYSVPGGQQLQPPSLGSSPVSTFTTTSHADTLNMKISSAGWMISAPESPSMAQQQPHFTSSGRNGVLGSRGGPLARGVPPNHRGGKDTEEDEDHHLAADDEKTAERPRRKRTYGMAGRAAPGHRRTRSGDAVAATLMTGGTDWTGMVLDRLPLPDPVDHEEDDEDDANDDDDDGQLVKGERYDKVGQLGGGKISMSSKLTNLFGASSKRKKRPVGGVGRGGQQQYQQAGEVDQRKGQHKKEYGATEEISYTLSDTTYDDDDLAGLRFALSSKGRAQTVSPNKSGVPSMINGVAHCWRTELDSTLEHSPKPIITSTKARAATDMSADTSRMSAISDITASEIGSLVDVQKDLTHAVVDGGGKDKVGSNDHSSEDIKLRSGEHEKDKIQGDKGDEGSGLRSPDMGPSVGAHHFWKNYPGRRNSRSDSLLSDSTQETNESKGTAFSWFSSGLPSLKHLTNVQRNQSPSTIGESGGGETEGRSYQVAYSSSVHSSSSGSSSPSLSFTGKCVERTGHRSEYTHPGKSSPVAAGRYDENKDTPRGNIDQKRAPPSHLDGPEGLNFQRDSSCGQSPTRYQKSKKSEDPSGTADEWDRMKRFDSHLKSLSYAPSMPERRKFFAPAMTVVPEEEAGKYPTFICPKCHTRQREFFTVNSAPGQFEGPAGYLAFYFAVYVVASLFVFGLEEGWTPLDCVYFAVITVTTAGLGDLVPTTHTAKIICSIFIYFGVACIGLLLGTLLASGLDDASRKAAKENLVKNCPNCARLENATNLPFKQNPHGFAHPTSRRFLSERTASRPPPPVQLDLSLESQNSSRHSLYHLHQKKKPKKDFTVSERSEGRSSSTHSSKSYGREGCTRQDISFRTLAEGIPNQSDTPLNRDSVLPLGVSNSWGAAPTYHTPLDRGTLNAPQQCTSPPESPSRWTPPSPLPHEILARQSHSRHYSLDMFAGGATSAFSSMPPTKKLRVEEPVPQVLDEDTPFKESTDLWNLGARQTTLQREDDDYSSEYESDHSDTSYTTSSSGEDTLKPLSRIQAAKYVFLTLRQAVMNSIFIIAIGSFGFYFIEEMTAVDAFYFTTVLLTTVGYGDIVPTSVEGKMFATVYVLVAGTVLLHNMSMISMIPLELRKIRIERAVLMQFGDQLDDASLQELATGPLIKRLQLSASRRDGLDECTREMFALAMLVRLGRITERDVHTTFEAFRRLDLGNDGKLNSKDIIMAEMQKRRTLLRQKSNPDFVPFPKKKSRSSKPSFLASFFRIGNFDAAATSEAMNEGLLISAVKPNSKTSYCAEDQEFDHPLSPDEEQFLHLHQTPVAQNTGEYAEREYDEREFDRRFNGVGIDPEQAALLHHHPLSASPQHPFSGLSRGYMSVDSPDGVSQERGPNAIRMRMNTGESNFSAGTTNSSNIELGYNKTNYHWALPPTPDIQSPPISRRRRIGSHSPEREIV